METAEASAVAASSSENNASIYAQNASTSAGEASSSAENASTYADNAFTSAQNASASAGEASLSAENASTYADNASGYSDSAYGYYLLAYDSAQQAAGSAASLTNPNGCTRATWISGSGYELRWYTSNGSETYGLKKLVFGTDFSDGLPGKIAYIDIQSNGTLHSSTTITNGSDRRLKNNIAFLNSNELFFYDSLIPRSFSFKKDLDQKKEFGFIAQEVIESIKLYNLENSSFISNIYSKEDQQNYYTLNYNNFHALHVAKNHQQDEHQ